MSTDQLSELELSKLELEMDLFEPELELLDFLDLPGVDGVNGKSFVSPTVANYLSQVPSHEINRFSEMTASIGRSLSIGYSVNGNETPFVR
jgi:hypothetical protein